jgi:hypothetical protein
MLTMAKLSPHAKQRRKQMGVTEHQIDAAIADPDTVYPGSYPGHRAGRTCYQRGPIVVVVQDQTNQVITVLWHRKEGR